jgi:16S rRNA (adenine1518-N6/adenine1519-N6)-dimethyltransferase
VQTLSDIRQLLASRGLRPKHRLGQNFLHDHNFIRKLVEAANITPGDLVLEVGPGTGALTDALLAASASVIACEIDRDLAALLRERLGDRITLIEGDCLESARALNPRIAEAINSRGFKLVANLPYQVASPLITTLLIDHPHCVGQFVTIQREVAERLTAPPSTKAYGPLSIIVQSLADVKRFAMLPPTCFWPAPKVESAIVAVTPKKVSGTFFNETIENTGVIEECCPQVVEKVSDTFFDRRAFAAFMTELFTKRRKQLGTILGRQRREWADLAPAITPNLRPEALTPPELIRLWRAFELPPESAAHR